MFCCAACQDPAPQRGKFLHCLHVVCSACLTGCVDSDGVIECPLCAHITHPRLVGENLCLCLPDFFAHIHNPLGSDELHEDVGGATSGGDERERRPETCDFCEESLDASRATHCCLDCIPRPVFCRKHAESHMIPRIYRDHNVVALHGSGNMSSQQANERKVAFCPLHVNKRLKFYCMGCKRLACEVCCENGHKGEGHKVQGSQDTARQLRAALRHMLVEAGFDMDCQDSHPAHPLAEYMGGQEPIFNPREACLQFSQACLVGVDSALEEIQRWQQDLEQQAAEASEQVSTLMSRLHGILHSKEQSLRENLHEIFVGKQQVLSNKKSQLLATQETTAMIKHLSWVVARQSQMSDSDVIQLSHFIRKKMSKVQEKMTEGEESQAVGTTQLCVNEPRIQEAVNLIDSIATAVSFSMDFDKSVVQAPSRVLVGQDMSIRLLLRDSVGHAVPLSDTPLLTASLIRPDGNERRLNVRVLPCGHTANGEIVLCPAEEGKHSITISDGRTSKHIEFFATRSHPRALRASVGSTVRVSRPLSDSGDGGLVSRPQRSGGLMSHSDESEQEDFMEEVSPIGSPGDTRRVCVSTGTTSDTGIVHTGTGPLPSTRPPNYRDYLASQNSSRASASNGATGTLDSGAQNHSAAAPVRTFAQERDQDRNGSKVTGTTEVSLMPPQTSSLFSSSLLRDTVDDGEMDFLRPAKNQRGSDQRTVDVPSPESHPRLPRRNQSLGSSSRTTRQASPSPSPPSYWANDRARSNTMPASVTPSAPLFDDADSGDFDWLN